MVSIEIEEPIATSYERTGLEYNSQTTRGVGANVFKAIVELEEPITTQGEGGMIAAECKSVTANVIYSYKSQTTKPVTASVFVLFDPTDWLYRDDVSIKENSGADLTDFQVLLELTAENFDFTQAQDNGEDIRFTNTDLKFLPYWIESWDKAGQTAKIWIKIPSIPASSTVTIWFYYGNADVSSASNGTNTFLFFDDFEVDSDSDYEIKEDGGQDAFSYDETNDRISIDSIRGRDGISSYYLRNVAQNTGWYVSMKGRLGTPSGTSYDNILGIWLSKEKGNVAEGSATRTDFYTRVHVSIIEPSSYEGTVVGFHKDGSHTSEKILQQLHDQDVLFELWATSDTMKGKVSVGGVTKHEKEYSHTVSLSDINYLVWGDLEGPPSYVYYTAPSVGWMDEFRVRKYASPEPDCSIKTMGETVKSIGLNVHVKPANCKTVKTVIEQHGFSVKDITALIHQYGAAVKDIIADIVYYSWRTKPVTATVTTHGYTHRLIKTKVELRGEITKTVTTNVIRRGKTLKNIQTKIWWNSSKTLRNVRAKIGEPANTRHITLKVGFPKTTRPVRLKTPTGYKEIWKRVSLKAEKYSELVTRIIVADTRQTARGTLTKIISLSIAKFPYNAKSVTANVLLRGETVRVIRCTVLQVTGTTSKTVGCNVNKSRQIIGIKCNIIVPKSQTVKAVKTGIWSDTSETAKSVIASILKPASSSKHVKTSVWYDLSETVRAVKALIETRGHPSYRVVHANTQPTHRWTPVSCSVVNQSEMHKWVKANVLTEKWSYIWKPVGTKIEKNSEPTRNIRARRIVKANVHFDKAFKTRWVTANVNVIGANTRAVSLNRYIFSVYGTITDKNGNPVKDATVFLYKRGSGAFVTPKTTTTNYNGDYEIPKVPDGKYYVLAIKLAHDLVFSPIVMNGAHVDIEKNMPCYEVSKDVCIEEILSPIGDVFRFQVIYDETFADGTRITDTLLIWGDLYGTLPLLYRDTDGIFMVESPASARLTVLHDFWETGGTREEGKDDHFMKPVVHQLPSNRCYCSDCKREIVKEEGTEGTPCSLLTCPYCGKKTLTDVYYTNEPTAEYPSNVSWFNWKASLYTPNFVGFIVRTVSRADVYTILSTNIGGYYEIPASPPSDPVPPSQKIPPTGGGVTRGRTVHASVSPQPGSPKVTVGCKIGTHEVLEYCPDGITEKRWRDCV